MDEVKAFLAEHPNVKIKTDYSSEHDLKGLAKRNGGKIPKRQFIPKEFKASDPHPVPKEYPKGKCPREDEEQAEFVRWLETQRPDVKFFAVPNGGGRSKREGAKFKATGVKAGVPDLMICEPRGIFHGLFIEMKRIKGSKLNEPDQILWKDILWGKGYCVVMAKGAEEAKAFLDAYLENGQFRGGK